VVAESAFEAEIQNAFQILKGTPFETCLTHPLKNQIFPQTYSCDTELLKIARQLSFTSKNKIYFGNMVTSNNFPAPVELYEEIKNRNALSIDMETSAIYQVAWLFDIPILAIRGISNVLTSAGTDDNIQASNLSDSAMAAATVTLDILEILMLQLKSQNSKSDNEIEITEEYH
jgi:adenosylhomocysteine nucleosidase